MEHLHPTLAPRPRAHGGDLRCLEGNGCPRRRGCPSMTDRFFRTPCRTRLAPRVDPRVPRPRGGWLAVVPSCRGRPKLTCRCDGACTCRTGPKPATLGERGGSGGQGVPRNARGTDAHAGRSVGRSVGVHAATGITRWAAGTGMLHALVQMPLCPRSSPPLPGELRVIENWCGSPSDGRRHRGLGGSPVGALRAQSGRSGGCRGSRTVACKARTGTRPARLSTSRSSGQTD